MKLRALFNKLFAAKKTATPDIAAPAPAKKIYIRFSTHEDQEKLFAFYDLNSHKNVVRRETDLISRMIDDGNVIQVEDEDGKLYGASISYPYFIKNEYGQKEVKWQEIGTTRMVLNGYPGMIDAIVAMQVMRTYLVEPPSSRFVCHVITDPVQKMCHRLGFRSYDVPDEMLAAKAEMLGTTSTAGQIGNWFQCGMEAMPVLARHMINVMDNPVISHVKTGERIELDFSRSNFFTHFSPEIRGLGQKDLGNVDQPDLTRGVKENQKKWMYNFFR